MASQDLSAADYRLEPKSQSSGSIEFVQKVAVSHDPASAPDWVAPESPGTGSDVRRRPFRLKTHSQSPVEVVFRPRTKVLGETRNTAITAAGDMQVGGAQPCQNVGSQFRSRGEVEIEN